MNRSLLILLLLGLSILLSSCGGGGGGGTARDLQSLVGIWTATVTTTGNFGGEPFSDTGTIQFTISRTSVVDQDGDAWTWSYDGSTLELTLGESFTDFDVDCGTLNFVGTANYNWVASDGTSTATLNGTIEGTVSSDLCVTVPFDLTVTGPISRA